ncbi:MAG TPA: hypothetical protein VHP14_17685 [Anaerolineales bacterium]|nr:hypothetical protein [Anaerolineales bacterium]
MKRLFVSTAIVLVVAFLLTVAISLQTTGPSRKGSYCADKSAGTQLWAEVRCP